MSGRGRALGPVLLAAAFAYGWWPPPAGERGWWLLSWTALVLVAYAGSYLLERRREAADDAPSPATEPDWRAAVAHDVRTPLMRMRLAVDALAAEGSAGEARAAVLEAELLRLEHLAQGLVDLGVPPDQGTDAALDAGGVCRALAERAQPFFEAAGYRLAWRLDPAAPVAISRLALERVVDNLLGNALRHGAGEGEVRLFLGMDGPLWLALEVRNPAPPPTAAIEALARPFVRGDDGGEGFGLGLAVVERLATAAGGRLRLAYANGHFRARVLLPRAGAAAG